MSKILIFGDICPDNNFRYLFDRKAVLSSVIIEDIKKADLTVANLECPATNNTIPNINNGILISAVSSADLYIVSPPLFT